MIADRAARWPPAIMPATESRSVASLESPYSGSEGEMLRKRFPQSSRLRVVENPVLLWFSSVSGSAAARAPAATNCRARHSMSEDRAPSGRRTDITSKRLQSFQMAQFVLRRPVWQVGQRRHPVATNRVARHSMSEDRAPSCGVRFASKTNSQMSSGSKKTLL